RVVNQLDRAAEVQPANDCQAAFQRSRQEGGAKRDQYRHAEVRPALAGAEGPKLDNELMFAGVPVADQIARAGVKILLGEANTLPERRRRGLVEYANTAARSLGDLDPIQACRFVGATRTDRKYLTGRQRIAADAALALKFGRRDELLDPVEPDRVA